MSSFKHPSFQDRASQAAGARAKALEQLRLRPEPSEQQVAERKAAGARRAAAQAEKSMGKRAAAEAASTAKAVAKAQPVPTEAERKSARDARYAARKARG
jgi:hypothetical protein